MQKLWLFWAAPMSCSAILTAWVPSRYSQRRQRGQPRKRPISDGIRGSNLVHMWFSWLSKVSRAGLAEIICWKLNRIHLPSSSHHIPGRTISYYCDWIHFPGILQTMLAPSFLQGLTFHQLSCPPQKKWSQLGHTHQPDTEHDRLWLPLCSPLGVLNCTLPRAGQALSCALLLWGAIWAMEGAGIFSVALGAGCRKKVHQGLQWTEKNHFPWMAYLHHPLNPPCCGNEEARHQFNTKG